jgi:hypothetical protein
MNFNSLEGNTYLFSRKVVFEKRWTFSVAGGCRERNVMSGLLDSEITGKMNFRTWLADILLHVCGFLVGRHCVCYSFPSLVNAVKCGLHVSSKEKRPGTTQMVKCKSSSTNWSLRKNTRRDEWLLRYLQMLLFRDYYVFLKYLEK